MIKLFSYEYRFIGRDTEWFPHFKSFATVERAEAHANRKRDCMLIEGAPVECRIVELVSDGKSGRKPVAI